MSSLQTLYHFCTWQGWRAGPALASSVRLQRWGGAEEEENERRCHRTEKKTHKNLVFSSDLSFDMDTCSATKLRKRPQKSCCFFLSNMSFDIDSCSASGRHNVVVVWRGVQSLWDRAQVWKYIKRINIKRDQAQVKVVVVYCLKYYYYGLCRVYGKDFHSIQSQKVGTRWKLARISKLISPTTIFTRLFE